MIRNAGRIDRILRVATGTVIIGCGVHFSSYWGIVGAIPILTGLIGWCPAYTLLGISSCCGTGVCSPDTTPNVDSDTATTDAQ